MGTLKSIFNSSLSSAKSNFKSRKPKFTVLTDTFSDLGDDLKSGKVSGGVNVLANLTTVKSKMIETATGAFNSSKFSSLDFSDLPKKLGISNVNMPSMPSIDEFKNKMGSMDELNIVKGMAPDVESLKNIDYAKIENEGSKLIPSANDIDPKSIINLDTMNFDNMTVDDIANGSALPNIKDIVNTDGFTSMLPSNEIIPSGDSLSSLKDSFNISTGDGTNFNVPSEDLELLNQINEITAKKEGINVNDIEEFTENGLKLKAPINDTIKSTLSPKDIETSSTPFGAEKIKTLDATEFPSIDFNTSDLEINDSDFDLGNIFDLNGDNLDYNNITNELVDLDNSTAEKKDYIDLTNLRSIGLPVRDIGGGLQDIKPSDYLSKLFSHQKIAGSTDKEKMETGFTESKYIYTRSIKSLGDDAKYTKHISSYENTYKDQTSSGIKSLDLLLDKELPSFLDDVDKLWGSDSEGVNLAKEADGLEGLGNEYKDFFKNIIKGL